MGDSITVRASDGHEFAAYVAQPEGEPIAGLVVVQEIFGVNAHIRRVTDGWARDGFLAIAPALFDRVERGVELGYEGADLEKARSFSPRIDMDQTMLDVEAALKYVADSTGKKVGVIGYCFGGTIAWLAATRLHASATVGYYGGKIRQYAEEKPKCPVMLHFGLKDAGIPPDSIKEGVAALHPEVPIFFYDAGHGFNCDARPAFHPESARVARERSLEFLKENLL